MSSKEYPHIILKALKEGDKTAFDEIYKTYYERLCRYLLSYTHDQDKIEDIVQETFIALWNKRRELDIKNSPESYLFRTARNRFIDTYRKKERLNSFLLDYYHTALIRANRQPDDYKKKQLEKLKNCLAKLPRRCREIFTASKLTHRTNQEVAKEFNLSIKTVEGHISNGYRLLKECIEKQRDELQ